MADILKFDFDRDYERILRFLSDCYKENNGTTCWLPERYDDFVYRVDMLWAQAHNGIKLLDSTFVVEESGEIVACILPDGDNFCVSIKKGFESIYPGLLSFAEKELRHLFQTKENSKVTFFAVVNECQSELQAHLIAQGYEKYPVLQYDNLLHPQEQSFDIDLPNGFSVAYGEDVSDEAYKSWVCNVGFHPEREQDSDYLNQMDMAPYHSRKRSVFYQDSFECLIKSDSGELCAYSFCYINKSAKTAYIEPLCTRQAYRKMGFGKAMLGGIAARCKALGITDCWVASFGDDRRDFYKRAGFVPHSAESFWKKEL